MNAYSVVQSKTKWFAVIGVFAIASVLVGCGGGSSGTVSAFEIGFDDGFADDDLYYTGYDDSWFTTGFGPLLYQGGDIPFIDDFSYLAGFYDGQFYAYNDGYFIAYRYAFIIGFSEGYDSAFAPDYLTFLAFDQHTEFLTGGFSDGYYDGFTEGRVFGAFDYETFRPFDWLDALRDWESGTDLYFEEVDVGTGAFGPAVLYEWGTDPFFLRSGVRGPRIASDPSKAMRGAESTNDWIAESRPLDDAQTGQLQVSPDEAARSGRTLTLDNSWLDRINDYEAGVSTRSAPGGAAPGGDARTGARVQ